MHTQASCPERFTDPLIRKLYEAAELAGMTREQRTKIDAIMTTQLDINGWINHAYDKGLAEGEAKGKAEVAAAMLKLGIAPEVIIQVTGLTAEEIQAL